jgi:Cyclic nucleotide-binding domain/HEAT repeats
MTEALFRLFPAVRPAERGRFLFFFGLLALVTLAQTVGLVGAEALFLARLGSRQLPLAIVISAAATVTASLAYAAVVGRARNDSLFAGLLAGAAALLAAGGAAAAAALPAAPLALFAAWYVTQAVFTNHYWTFAGDFFDTLASKRLFPLFMAGSSVGGAAGGALALEISGAAPPEALIAAWAAGLAASALLLRALRGRVRTWGPLGYEEADETSVAGLRAALRYARHSPLARWLVLAVLAMVTALFTAQYLYLGAFGRRFPDGAALAAFFGTFLMLSNLAELAVEMAFTPWLIRRFGVASANLLHPVTTLAAFGGLAFDLSLIPAMVARLNREMLDNALAQPVRNLVYNALPERLRGRMRAFLEGIVVYSGMGIAGAALLALPSTSLDAQGTRLLCALGGFLALLYLAANLGARRAYLEALVEELRAGRLDLRDVGDALGGFEVQRLAELWRELLARPGSRGSAGAASELAPLLAARGVVEPLVFAAGHRDPDVRRISVEALAGVDDEAAHAAILGSLEDRDPAVRGAALRALRGKGPLPEPAPGALRERLFDPDPDVRAEAAGLFGAEGLAALEAMAASKARGEAVAALERLPASLALRARERAADADPPIRAAALRCLARIGAAETLGAEEVAPLVEHPDAEVRLAAVAFLSAAGSEAAARALGGALDDPVRAVREAGTAALARLGDRGVEAARPHLEARGLWTVDAALAAVAGAGTPRSRATLVAELRRHVLAAWEHRLALESLGEPHELALRFLRAAHASAFDREIRLVFRLLELLEGPAVVRSVQRTLRLAPPRARADALEVLSNLGDRQAAALLALLHEGGNIEDRIRGIARFAGRPRTPEAALAAAREAGDPWIRLAARCGPGAASGDGEERHIMERLLALREIPIFAHLRLDQLESIQRAMREETYMRGEVVVREGEPGNELYLVLEGEVEVWIDHGGPAERRVNVLPAVGWFGEMAALDDETRTATIVVSRDARLASLAGERLKELILSMPEISFEIFRELIARVRRAERHGREGE